MNDEKSLVPVEQKSVGSYGDDIVAVRARWGQLCAGAADLRPAARRHAGRPGLQDGPPTGYTQDVVGYTRP